MRTAEAAVADTWIDPSSHWKATGRLLSNGSLTGVTVEDANGITWARYLHFTSEQDFISWVRRLSNLLGHAIDD